MEGLSISSERQMSGCNSKNNIGVTDQTQENRESFAEMGLEKCCQVVAASYGKRGPGREAGGCDMEAGGELLYMEQLPLEQLEDRLLEIVRSCPLPEQYQALPAMRKLQTLYNHFNQPGALKKSGAREELADYPLLQKLLSNSSATCHRLESLQLIKNGSQNQAARGLNAPVVARSRNVSATPDKKEGSSLFERRLAQFIKNESGAIINGPGTPTQYSLLAEKFFREDSMLELKNYTKEEFAQSVAAALRQGLLAENPGAKLSVRDGWQLERLGDSVAEAFALYAGTKINISLGGRVLEYARSEQKKWQQKLFNGETTAFECQPQIDHYGAIIEKLSSRGELNPLAAMEARLFKDFPVIGAEVLHDYGLPGGVAGNMLEQGVTDYKEWKESTDAVYFALADIATSISHPLNQAVKGVKLGLDLTRKMRELNQRETFYSPQERFGRAVVEMAVEAGVDEVFDSFKELGIETLKISERYPQVTLEAITWQYNFLLRDDKKKAGEAILP